MCEVDKENVMYQLRFITVNWIRELKWLGESGVVTWDQGKNLGEPTRSETVTKSSTFLKIKSAKVVTKKQSSFTQS